MTVGSSAARERLVLGLGFTRLYAATLDEALSATVPGRDCEAWRAEHIAALLNEYAAELAALGDVMRRWC
jgi:hypothetical protein